MNPPVTQLLVAIVDRVVVIKIMGRANFTLSVDFKRLVAELRARGHNRFALELSQCLMMDSTFLGVLAGFGLKLAESRNQTDSALICLQNPNPRLRELLENPE